MNKELIYFTQFKNEINNEIESLPENPWDIVLISKQNGNNIKKLSCCIKLIQIFRSLISDFNISKKPSMYIDNENKLFEEELTVSKKFSNNSITTIFTCCLISIGHENFETYKISNSSSNPFVQCARLLFRFIWFLKCRSLLLYSIQKQNYQSIINYSLRLSSFRDFSTSSQRSALYSCVCYPEKVDLRLFSYFIPEKFITDSTRTLYNDFLELNSKKKYLFIDHILEVDRLYNDQCNLFYFGSKTNLENSILSFFSPEKLYSNNLLDFFSIYLYEIVPDEERNLYYDLLLNSSLKAQNLIIPRIRKKYDLQSFIDFHGYLNENKNKFNDEEFTLNNIFLPPKNFLIKK